MDFEMLEDDELEVFGGYGGSSFDLELLDEELTGGGGGGRKPCGSTRVSFWRRYRAGSGSASAPEATRNSKNERILVAKPNDCVRVPWESLVYVESDCSCSCFSTAGRTRHRPSSYALHPELKKSWKRILLSRLPVITSRSTLQRTVNLRAQNSEQQVVC